jgi:hypothetical protein
MRVMRTVQAHDLQRVHTLRLAGQPLRRHVLVSTARCELATSLPLARAAFPQLLPEFIMHCLRHMTSSFKLSNVLWHWGS